MAKKIKKGKKIFDQGKYDKELYKLGMHLLLEDTVKLTQMNCHKAEIITRLLFREE